jgi:mRNA-degrading endonuclease RelE of RelBE toxin-antitoxin system
MVRPEFRIEFAPEVLRHLQTIPRQQHNLLRTEIHDQLRFTPLVQTRNRKPLELPAPFAATWELRCGPRNRFRVFYTVDKEANTVNILAIGVKEGNRLYIGREEYRS